LNGESCIGKYDIVLSFCSFSIKDIAENVCCLTDRIPAKKLFWNYSRKTDVFRTVVGASIIGNNGKITS